MGATLAGRRARYQAATREEAKTIALRQLAAGGIAALSLNAIGKAMGLTGPALYRYFASRDALLTDLIVDAYGDLAAAIEAATVAESEAEPAAKLRALAATYRAWALAEPHRYLLLYGTPVPDYVAPPDTVGLARRIMAPFLAALADSPSVAAPADSPHATLDAQFAAWVRETGQEIDGTVLRRGLTWWTRLHGLLSLELAGHFSSMGFDPALFFDTEVSVLLDGGDNASGRSRSG